MTIRLGTTRSDGESPRRQRSNQSRHTRKNLDGFIGTPNFLFGVVGEIVRVVNLVVLVIVVEGRSESGRFRGGR